jgi:nucleotide-binding universal stress UspA family protein
MTSDRAILVGIDGSRAGWHALDWAADEAELTARPLVVAHVGDVEPVAGTVDERSFGRELLDEAVANLADSHPTLLVTTELVTGDPARKLVELSTGTEIVVVGRGRRGLPGLLLGSVAFRVLAHAQSATAVVAAGSRVSANRIVVGTSDSAGGQAALRFTFEEAMRRGAEVVAVRSWSERDWRLAAAAALPTSSPEMWEAQERTVLEDCVRPMHEAFPAVPVRLVLTGAPTEIALEQESEDAAMLVLGCRRADDSRLPRLGPIASWAAHQFRCPVVIVGHPLHDLEPVDDAGLASATAG